MTMRKVRRYIMAMLTCAITMAMLTACSTQKNTSSSRWWHAFNARYNTYFNGSEAFIEGSQEKESQHKDNFTEQLPLYAAGTKSGRDIGKDKFDRAIEKAEKAIKRHSIKRRPQWTKKRRKTERDIEWLSRREYNPFIWKAWLLLGKSQFQKGEFEEAAATFSYISRLYATQPAINGIARAWLVKSYSEMGWIYEAEDVIMKMKRDTMHYRAIADWDYAYCDFYLHSGKRKEAITYLKKVIRHEKRKKLKARQWYIMGQLLAEEGDKQGAYKAFRKVVALNPPYELAFNARIAQTEVMASGGSKKMIGKLRRMAASDNNKDYLEQVYYAIGNIHLMKGDTLKAISAYEEGNRKATRNGIEKGVLLLKLGNLYWQRQQYPDAGRCYGEAIGLLDKDRKDYAEMDERSKVLDLLVPHVNAIHLQDSLQYLATAPEDVRNAAIDRQIELLKKKEKEERDAQMEQEAEQKQRENAQGNANNNRNDRTNTTQQNTPGGKAGVWYFYNPLTVSQGKATFERMWGKRDNVDNWQRINQTVVQLNDDFAHNNEEEQTDTDTDDTTTETTKDDGPTTKSDDPHTREYYLAQIPMTTEQKEASDRLIAEALIEGGIILKDKMDKTEECCKYLERLLNSWPDYERNDETCYHLFLAYSRQGRHTDAQRMVKRLQERHSESQYTRLLTNPYYLEDARWGEHIEDSIYAATYEAFKKGMNDVVKANTRISDERFEQGNNRPRFLFIDALTLLSEGDTKGCISRMTEVVEKHPTAEIAEMAGMIIKGVRQGRKLQGGGHFIGDIWNRRMTENMADTINADTLMVEQDANHVVIMAFPSDSIDSNQMLYELAKYNFTNFLVRNFEIAVAENEGLSSMTVSGFTSYDEALQYRQQLTRQFDALKKENKNIRLFIVSERNLQLLGTTFSYAEYDEWFDTHFAPLAPVEQPLLNEPTEVVRKEVETEDDDGDNEQEEEEEENDDNMFDFDEDFYR